MRYELFLRRPSQPLTDEELAAAAAAVERDEGDRLTLEPFRRPEDGALLGLDLGVAVEEPGGAARLCRQAFALAGAHDLAVFDPQLGRTVVPGEEELIEQRFDQGAAFSMAAPIGGASVPGGGGVLSTGGLSPGVKLWLAVIGLIALLLLVGRLLRC